MESLIVNFYVSKLKLNFYLIIWENRIRQQPIYKTGSLQWTQKCSSPCFNPCVCKCPLPLYCPFIVYCSSPSCLGYRESHLEMSTGPWLFVPEPFRSPLPVESAPSQVAAFPGVERRVAQFWNRKESDLSNFIFDPAKPTVFNISLFILLTFPLRLFA